MNDRAANTDGESDPAVTRLAEEIRRLRKDADLSHAQLAGQIGYTRQYVSLAERRSRPASCCADCSPADTTRPRFVRCSVWPAAIPIRRSPQRRVT
ncbi:MAG: helix-turn-helix transcriptional regulator [Actinobacteria bacterium]|nr:helix-turn-helix transcriptional regulator [Actinomycetota bacterium]